MRRTRNDEPAVTAKIDEPAQQGDAFVESAPPQTEQSATSAPRSFRVKVSDDGALNLDDLPEHKKAQFLHLLSQDPDVLEYIGKTLGGEEPSSEVEIDGVTITVVKEEHIAALLDMFAFAERQVMPKVIEKQLAQRGLMVKIPPHVISTIFRFDKEEKEDLCPCGAEFANQLPEPVKKVIVKVGGPGPQFITKFVAIQKAKIEACIEASVRIAMAQQQPQPTQSQPAAEEPVMANA